MDNCKVERLLNINETIAKDIFKNVEYPWEVLPRIKDFIIELGNSLDKTIYEEVKENVWIAKSAKIMESSFIVGPCIIDENADIRYSAFIRENVIVGKNVVVGNSTELKNAILFNNVQVPHYNYVGDSILGFKSHMGAGSILSNVKSDKKEIQVKDKERNIVIDTGLLKFGAILGDNVEVGCGAVLNPGTVVGRNTTVYPLSLVRGMIYENLIYKNQIEIVEKSGMN